MLSPIENFEQLSESEQLQILRERDVKRERECRDLRKQLAQFVQEVQEPVDAADLNSPRRDRERAALQHALTLAREEEAAALQECNRGRNSNALLSKWQEKMAKRRQFEFELRKLTPTNLDTPEIVERTPADQRQLDELIREVDRCKAAISSTRASNASMVAFNMAQTKLREFQRDLDRKHRQKLQERERQRQAALQS